MIKILTLPHTLFAARILVAQLLRLGYNAQITPGIIKGDASLYIIYNAAACGTLPKNYIVYQTEVPGSRWFSKKYYDSLAGALAIFDYHSDNVNAYKHLHHKIAVVTPGVQPMAPVDKDIPVLFYGWLSGSVRRQQLLAQLQRHLSIKVVTNITGKAMWHLLARTQVVINLHYYPQAPLEVFRINEALSYRCQVVSEYSATTLPQYDNLVRYSDTIEGFVNEVQSCLIINKPVELSSLDNLQELKEGIKLVEEGNW